MGQSHGTFLGDGMATLCSYSKGLSWANWVPARRLTQFAQVACVFVFRKAREMPLPASAGYINKPHNKQGTDLQVVVRGKRYPAKVGTPSVVVCVCVFFNVGVFEQKRAELRISFHQKPVQLT